MGFFYTPKPKRFNYKPRYYDPIKDEREQKKAAMGCESTEMSHNDALRAKMHDRWSVTTERTDAKSRSRKLLKSLIVVGFIAALFYYIFCTDVFVNILRGLGIGQ